MTIIINFGILILNIIYTFIKLFPTKNKITFISRQSDTPSIDIKLLEKQIKNKDNNVEVVILCKKLKKGFKNKILYIFHMFSQMYHIATSKVVILDSYCISISILHHKKSLKVIQMWHGLGSFKKFGKSIIGKGESSVDIEGVNKIKMEKLTQIMKIHNNYDYVFTSSKASLKGFSEAFGYPISQFKIFPLPRVDLIMSLENQEKIKKKIYKKYPKLKKKKNILYCPTFRKDKSDDKYIKELIDKVDYKEYNLIIKLHPLTHVKIDDKRVIVAKHFTTYEMGFVSDYIITDYSAVVFELALLKKPLYFYSYDYDEYVGKRDFYLNYDKEMPGIISKDINKILNDIKANNYDLKKIDKFNKKYVKIPKGGCTNIIVDFIFKLI